VQPLWERYFHRLVQLARKRLQDSPRRAADVDDVAQSAFYSFCRHAEQGHYHDLRDRNSLWRLLAVITARKAARLRRDDSRKTRGGGNLPLPIIAANDRGHLEPGVFSREPSPEFAALMAEECTCLLRGLKDNNLENVALWRMEGYTIKEIAQKMDIVPRSVKRKLQLIRSLWRKEAES